MPHLQSYQPVAELIGKEIKYIPQLTAIHIVKLGVPASFAGYRSKLAVLYIKYFGPKTTGRSYFTCLKIPMVAFGT